jgi:hypothetical protein
VFVCTACVYLFYIRKMMCMFKYIFYQVNVICNLKSTVLCKKHWVLLYLFRNFTNMFTSIPLEVVQEQGLLKKVLIQKKTNLASIAVCMIVLKIFFCALTVVLWALQYSDVVNVFWEYQKFFTAAKIQMIVFLLMSPDCNSYGVITWKIIVKIVNVFHYSPEDKETAILVKILSCVRWP